MNYFSNVNKKKSFLLRKEKRNYWILDAKILKIKKDLVRIKYLIQDEIAILLSTIRKLNYYLL